MLFYTFLAYDVCKSQCIDGCPKLFLWKTFCSGFFARVCIRIRMNALSQGNTGLDRLRWLLYNTFINTPPPGGVQEEL